jgi:hypothetical protein
MGAHMDRPGIALYHHHLFRDTVDGTLVLLANWADEDDPVTFFVADAAVFFRFLSGGWALHNLFCL